MGRGAAQILISGRHGGIAPQKNTDTPLKTRVSVFFYRIPAQLTKYNTYTV
ncbi:hypothetical protein HMPREF9123_0205 [Neisseria bacilliformis ATCC BAA-1200]|uniref:Uncharacterized protein n=1 Tax=Neisseria bacilliformis ATCC BAA-1200 TaxID=888742 RepID=F2B962_9NEIS|nr:hypothetical protein HMPREF9123_0205 [Neisseria bacilliformis ATCC BAA-1200]